MSTNPAIIAALDAIDASGPANRAGYAAFLASERDRLATLRNTTLPPDGRCQFVAGDRVVDRAFTDHAVTVTRCFPARDGTWKIAWRHALATGDGPAAAFLLAPDCWRDRPPQFRGAYLALVDRDTGCHRTLADMEAARAADERPEVLAERIGLLRCERAWARDCLAVIDRSAGENRAAHLLGEQIRLAALLMAVPMAEAAE